MTFVGRNLSSPSFDDSYQRSVEEFLSPLTTTLEDSVPSSDSSGTDSDGRCQLLQLAGIQEQNDVYIRLVRSMAEDFTSTAADRCFRNLQINDLLEIVSSSYLFIYDEQELVDAIEKYHAAQIGTCSPQDHQRLKEMLMKHCRKRNDVNSFPFRMSKRISHHSDYNDIPRFRIVELEAFASTNQVFMAKTSFQMCGYSWRLDVFPFERESRCRKQYYVVVMTLMKKLPHAISLPVGEFISLLRLPSNIIRLCQLQLSCTFNLTNFAFSNCSINKENRESWLKMGAGSYMICPSVNAIHNPSNGFVRELPDGRLQLHCSVRIQPAPHV